MSSKKIATLETQLQQQIQGGDFGAMARICKRLLKQSPLHLLAHRRLGFALNELHQTEEALSVYEKAVRIWPQDAELLINFANALLTHGRNAQAIPLLQTVCQLKPDHAISWLKLAQACYLPGRNMEGYDATCKAMPLAQSIPEKVSAFTQSAIHRRELGQVREAVADCESALALFPQDITIHTNRLLFMLADPAATPQTLIQAARQFADIFEAPYRHLWPSFDHVDKKPWRRLRIGFVSPDFRTHSVMYFVEGLLAQLDRRMFEVWAFYLSPAQDSVTERVRCHTDHFVDLHGQSVAQQVATIRSKNIDIAIDLAGHTGGNALCAFAQRLAPVQISWLGYPATTGLNAIDYKITDEITDPPNVDTQYTEHLYRLPTFFCCYRPMSRQPLWRYQPAYQVRPTPALHNGYVTFGSCNNLGKLTDEVLTVWGQILQAVPQARLLIEGKNLADAEFAASYQARCARLGIDTKRLELVGLEHTNQYLTYHRIDIALDPFPLTGGTTSFDVLWMGVPMVSMVGDSFKSRMSTGILHYLGRADWLASNASQYVEIARSLATDLDALNSTRLGLRQALEQSPLMREDLFVHHFGEALRVMWLKWMAQTLHPQDETAQAQSMAGWLAEFPAEWEHPQNVEVGIREGVHLSLHQAHSQLEQLLDKAKANANANANASASAEPPITPKESKLSSTWYEVTDFATRILCAKPHDPVALAVLAEVEHAHGHTDFAVTYLRYAQEALSQQN